MNTPLEGKTLPLEHVAEYDAAAEYFARHYRLPDCMGSPGALDYIQADPEAFQDRVRQCRYANAMDSYPDEDWRIQLHAGDEVTWNDPDEGKCSRTGIIAEIDFIGQGAVMLRFMDGWESEVLLSELT